MNRYGSRAIVETVDQIAATVQIIVRVQRRPQYRHLVVIHGVRFGSAP